MARLLAPLMRRQFLHFAAGAAVLPLAASVARAQTAPASLPSELPAHPLAERLAAYAHNLRYSDLEAATIERVKSHLVDTLGCGIAALDEEPVRRCREVALAATGGPSTVIGTARRTTPDLASFANGTAFRYFDLNDVYVGRAACHPSDNIAACLAVAESERASAADLITAIALAYEINCRLMDAFDMSTRGWDDATLFSPPAVALAAGKLMKLGPDKLAQAVSLAINDHIPMGQTRAQGLSDWKGLADAEAGRNAVFATMLARAGITGPAPIFEGRKGFFQLVSGPADINVETFGGRGNQFKIHECGMKAYPVVVFAQTAVVASIELAKEVRQLDRIEAIEISTTPRGYQSAGKDPEKWTPKNRDTADHSLPYIAARAMFDGDLNNDSYSAEKLRDPRILAFMRKITVKEDSTFAPPRGSAPPIRIVATLADGQRVTHQTEKMPGFGGQPMDRADIERKFRSNIGKRWPKERADRILNSLWSLERLPNAGSLLGALTV
jgi:2-methylcitrate dehydratase